MCSLYYVLGVGQCVTGDTVRCALCLCAECVTGGTVRCALYLCAGCGTDGTVRCALYICAGCGTVCDWWHSVMCSLYVLGVGLVARCDVLSVCAVCGTVCDWWHGVMCSVLCAGCVTVCDWWHGAMCSLFMCWVWDSVTDGTVRCALCSRTRSSLCSHPSLSGLSNKRQIVVQAKAVKKPKVGLSQF